MKRVLASLICITSLSCKEVSKESKPEIKEPETAVNIATAKYPEALNKIFEAHGGLSNWKNKKTLSFQLPKPGAEETHTIDLVSRNEKIETPLFAMGYDGAHFWLADEKKAYKGDPVFYHNLMFYFFAMPFVLADHGIKYGSAENLEFEGMSYPGIHISYGAGVGTTPKDEYYLHYDPETYQMKWLGYTVTYRSGKKSDTIKWIRYNDWMDVDSIMLPKAITWHAYEGRKIKEAKNTVAFENVTLGMARRPKDFYRQPKNAIRVRKKEN